MKVEKYRKKENILKKQIVAILMIALLFCLFTACGPDDVTTEKIEETIGFCDDPAAISEAANSVVKLNCYDRNGDLLCTGSGFSAFDKGIILTNYHVIENWPDHVEIVTERGEKCVVTGCVGVSIERDIAILYYNDNNVDFELPVLPMNSSDVLQKGEKVVAIGSPLGITNVVSTGVFSGYAKIGDATDIQFTASISSGSSGGALFNNKGDVIGITYASITEGQNVNFAVPIEFAETLWKTEWQDRSPFESFYDSLVPHYSVDYVLRNFQALSNVEFYLDFWASSCGETADGIVGFCASSYDEIFDPTQNVPQVRFEADMDRYPNTQLLMVVCYETGYWSEQMMLSAFEKRGELSHLKCAGVEWSQADEKPIVIYGG